MANDLKKGQILTINPMGVFVDDVPVTRYNGEKIENIDHFSRCLIDDIIEVQLMQSDTFGKYGIAGNPKPTFDGRYVWMRARSEDNILSDWLFRANYSSLEKGVSFLPRWVITDASVMTSRRRPDFRTAIMGSIANNKIRLLADMER